MFKKFWNKIRVGFYYLIQGMISGDKVIKSGTGDDSAPIGGIEQQQEQQSVYKDLLRGEVTQEVKDLRYRTHMVGRKSREYSYAGGGHAKKNNFYTYSGNIDVSDNLPVRIVQENKEIIKGLSETGIDFNKNTNEVILAEELQGSFKVARNPMAEYTIKCERSFIPRFRIEQYTTKLVVKDADEEHVVLDFYIPQYRKQFDNVSKFVISELERVRNGNTRSDLVTIDSVSFITQNAYGAEDTMFFAFDKVELDDVIIFDGHYVLRFYAHILVDAEDIIEENYHSEEQAQKYATHAAREGVTADYDTEEAIKRFNEMDVTDELDLLNNLDNNEK